jgi:hypothetical protein
MVLMAAVSLPDLVEEGNVEYTLPSAQFVEDLPDACRETFLAATRGKLLHVPGDFCDRCLTVPATGDRFTNLVA